MLSASYTSFLVNTFTWLLSFLACAQSVPTEPEYTVFIHADGLPIDLEIGIPILAKTMTLTAQLTPQSVQTYPLLEPTVLIKDVVIYFVRNGRRYSVMLYRSGKRTMVVSLSLVGVQAGDRCFIEFMDVRTQTQAGVIRRFPRRKTILIPLRTL